MTTTRHRKRQRGQALVEFAMVIGVFVTIVMGSFYFGTILFQNWENGRFATWVGQDVTVNGTFNSQGDIVAQAGAYNIDLTNITVTVTVVHLDSTGSMTPDPPVSTIVRHGPCVGQIGNIAYGDYVSVTVQSTVNIPVLSNFMSDKSVAPKASGYWRGVSQMDDPAWPAMRAPITCA